MSYVSYAMVNEQIMIPPWPEIMLEAKLYMDGMATPLNLCIGMHEKLARSGIFIAWYLFIALHCMVTEPERQCY